MKTFREYLEIIKESKESSKERNIIIVDPKNQNQNLRSVTDGELTSYIIDNPRNYHFLIKEVEKGDPFHGTYKNIMNRYSKSSYVSDNKTKDGYYTVMSKDLAKNISMKEKGKEKIKSEKREQSSRMHESD